MTPEQILMAKALGAAGLFPGSNAKRFARDMASIATTAPATELTPGQHKYLCDLVFKYRRQCSARAVQAAQAVAIHGPMPAQRQAPAITTPKERATAPTDHTDAAAALWGRLGAAGDLFAPGSPPTP